MAHYNQNNERESAVRTRNHQAELEKDPINITYGILGQIFKVLDKEDISQQHCKKSRASLLYLKKVKILLRALSKNYIILWKNNKNYLKKPQMILRNYILTSQKTRKKKCLLSM